MHYFQIHFFINIEFVHFVQTMYTTQWKNDTTTVHCWCFPPYDLFANELLGD
jgi:hypothetical protein